jgi:hypothetical protein
MQFKVRHDLAPEVAARVSGGG